jgi:mono/diheme cytochrome c family protein
MELNFITMLQRSSLFLAIVMLWGCVHDPLYTPDPQPAPGTDPTVVEGPCDPETVYFQQDVLPLIIANCAQSGCHDAATAEDGIVLDSFSSILYGDDEDLVVPGQPGESELLAAILETDPDKVMPPPPAEPLDAAMVDLITEWIAQGALNLSCQETECDTADHSWTGRILPLFELHCIGCHGGAEPEAGLLLGEHAQAVTAVTYMALLEHVQQLEGYSPMPPSGPGLDSCEIAAIEGWIADGMPEN